MLVFLFLMFSTSYAIYIGKEIHYTEYHLESKCFSNETIRYHLEPYGLNSAAKIYATPPVRFAGNRSCEILIDVLHHSDRGLSINVESLKFHSNVSDCSGSITLFLRSQHSYSIRPKTLCSLPNGAQSFTSWVSPGQSFRMVYKTTHHASLKEQSDFFILITVFSKPRFFGCDPTRLRCSNERCIWKPFACDGYNNCGDYSEEDDFGKYKCYLEKRAYCWYFKQKYQMECNEIQKLPSKTVPVINIPHESTQNEYKNSSLPVTTVSLTTEYETVSTTDSILSTTLDQPDVKTSFNTSTSKTSMASNLTEATIVTTEDFAYYQDINTSNMNMTNYENDVLNDNKSTDQKASASRYLQTTLRQPYVTDSDAPLIIIQSSHLTESSYSQLWSAIVSLSSILILLMISIALFIIYKCYRKQTRKNDRFIPPTEVFNVFYDKQGNHDPYLMDT